MSSTAPIRSEQTAGRMTMTGSANWSFDNGIRPVFDPPITPAGRVLSQLALAALLAVSSMSSGPDPWAGNQRRYSELTMSRSLHASGRRRITGLEARRLALQMLYRAEAGRAQAAEAEAKRGIDWEENS